MAIKMGRPKGYPTFLRQDERQGREKPEKAAEKAI